MKQSTLMGRPRWQVVLAVVFFAQLMTSTGFSIVFPFLPLYVEDLGSSMGFSVELLAGAVIGVQGFTMMLASPLWGAVADRYGRKLMVMRAMFGGAVIMLMMGFVSTAEQLVLLRGIQGFITGTVAANNALVASKTPRNRIGFAMGTLQVGLWSGLAVGPLIGGVLADSFGFAMPFVFTSALLLLSGVLIFFAVDEEFTPSVASSDEASRPGFFQQWQHVITSEGVRTVFVMRFLAGVGRMVIVPIAPLFVVSLLPVDAAHQSIYAGMVISVSSATSSFSGVYLGRLGDRIGHRRVLIVSAVASLLLYIPQVFVADFWQLLVLQGLAGFALGGLIASPSALLAQYTEAGEEGAVYGLDNSVVSSTRFVAPMIGGLVAELSGYRGAFALTAILYAIVAVAAWRLLPDPHKQKVPSSQAAVALGD